MLMLQHCCTCCAHAGMSCIVLAAMYASMLSYAADICTLLSNLPQLLSLLYSVNVSFTKHQGGGSAPSTPAPPGATVVLILVLQTSKLEEKPNCEYVRVLAESCAS
jgi:hypothetical protein